MTVNVDNKLRAELFNIIRWMSRQTWSEWSFEEAQAIVTEQWLSRGYSASDANANMQLTLHVWLADRGQA